MLPYSFFSKYSGRNVVQLFNTFVHIRHCDNTIYSNIHNIPCIEKRRVHFLEKNVGHLNDAPRIFRWCLLYTEKWTRRVGTPSGPFTIYWKYIISIKNLSKFMATTPVLCIVLICKPHFGTCTDRNIFVNLG